MRAAHGSPLVVRGDGTTETLRRIPFQQAAGEPTRYDEDWIQRVIYSNPEVLPISEIDRAFAPAYPLAREVPTAAGPIDAVLISPTGYLTLVETKLWRSPEARREVVGQIIDYAKEFTKWTPRDLYAALEGAFERAASHDVYAYLQRQGVDISEQEFTDSLAVNLERGRILLLLAGDGIRESVQDIAEYLERFARIQFALGLVDLAVYQQEDGARLVVPRLVSRTREVTRAVIRIEGTGATVAQIDVAPEHDKRASAQRFTLTEGDFLAQLDREAGPPARAVVTEILAFMRELGLEPDYRQSSFTARLSNRLGGTAFSMFNVSTQGTIAFGYLRSQLERYGLPLDIQETYASDIAQRFNVAIDKWGYPNSISFKKYREQPGALKAVVAQAIERLNTAET